MTSIMRSSPLSEFLRRVSTSTSPKPSSASPRSTSTPKRISLINPLSHRKHISTYGYTQATSLLHHTTGPPSTVLQLHKHSIAPAHSNLLTLRTLAAPLNPADINQIQGTYATKPRFNTSLGTALPAAIPGSEGVFEVIAVGGAAAKPEGGSWERGQWVIPRSVGLGTWRTHLQVDSGSVIRINKSGLNAIDAARVSVNPLTAWRMLKDFLPPSDPQTKTKPWVIQNGGNSGVGRLVSQLARLWGINSISIIRERPEPAATEALKSELLALGATHVLTESESQSPSFVEQVRSWTATPEKGNSGGSLPLALNCVGGKPSIALAKVLSPGGVMVTYGAMSKQPLIMPAGLLIFRDIRFQGFWVSSWAGRNPEEKERCVAGVLDLVREGRLDMGPVEEVRWGRNTGREELVGAVEGTLEGYRAGKGVFVFDGDV